MGGWEKEKFRVCFLLVGRRIHGGLNERKEIYLIRGGWIFTIPRAISRRTHGRKRVTAQKT